MTGSSPAATATKEAIYGHRRTASSVLSSLSMYDTVRVDYAANITREEDQLLDILHRPNDGDGDGDKLGFCHLVTFLPFTQLGEPNIAAQEYAVGVALAIHHLNVGDGSLIGEVEGLNDRCNIRFTTDFADCGFEAGYGVTEIVRLTDPARLKEGGQLPCAIVGPTRSAVSGPTSIVSGLRNYPQISGASTSADLDDKELYPKFARTIPSDDGTAEAIVVYLRHQLGLQRLAVININDSFGNSFVRGLRAAATIAAPDLIIHQILLDSDDDNSNRQAIQALKETQLQFIFLIALSQKTHDDVMTEAVRMGVAGTGVHNWVFSDLFLLTVQGRLFEQNSPLHKAYSGVGMLKASGTAGPKFDDFSKKLKLVKNPDDFEYLNAMVPGFNQTSFTNRDTFLDPLSYDFTAFFYEATVLVGMSACAAVADAGSGDNLTLTGDTLYDHMLKFPSFDGVTGNVKLDPWTGSRLPSSAFYEVTNFVQQEVVDPDSGKTMIMFKQVLTDVYYNGTWVNKNSFVFNDGTTNLPYGIPQPSPDQQYVNPAVRALAYTFYAVAIILAAWFGFWAYRNRETRVVKASQPFFLYLICGGCVIYATTIIALSFDSRNTSIGGCSIACTLSMWLLFVGFTFIFSALFAKTHRINKIMKNAKQFRRVKVTVRDTLKPVIVLLTLNVILLTLMTVLYPPDYVISVESTDVFGQPSETFGNCDFHGSMWLIGGLCLLNFAILLLALWEAWQARHLSTEFAESQYIFLALVCMFLVACVGAPVLVIAYDNVDASLFVSSAMIFLSACAILFLIFMPKIQYERQRLAGDPSRRDVIKITGIGPATGSSAQYTAGPSLFEGSGQACGAEGEDSADLGERILTTKTQKELAEENALLKRLLRREREANGRGLVGQDAADLTTDPPETRVGAYREGVGGKKTAALKDDAGGLSDTNSAGVIHDRVLRDEDDGGGVVDVDFGGFDEPVA